MAEQYTNIGLSTLAQDYVVGSGVMIVSDVSSFPSTGSFSVNVDDIIYTVSSVVPLSGTFNVTLEDLGPDTAHSAGATISEVITVRVIDQIRSEIAAGMSTGYTGYTGYS